ncbi:MAG: hypothetical protein R2856_14755 [Caldilineaceae bacterium]
MQPDWRHRQQSLIATWPDRLVGSTLPMVCWKSAKPGPTLVSYTVTQADIDNNGGGDGDIDNTATVSSNEAPNRSDSEAVIFSRTQPTPSSRRPTSRWLTLRATLSTTPSSWPTPAIPSLTGVTVSDPLLGTVAGPVGRSIDMACWKSAKPGLTPVPTPSPRPTSTATTLAATSTVS